jgi:asparagine synthase (glutamine-hydrolysing)
MRDAMTPRGPDGCGFVAGPGFALGHRRFSIIDLSDAGQQPMWNEDRTVTIVFNGEIYNFLELRRRSKKEDVGIRYSGLRTSKIWSNNSNAFQKPFEPLKNHCSDLFLESVLRRSHSSS